MEKTIDFDNMNLKNVLMESKNLFFLLEADVAAPSSTYPTTWNMKIS